MADDPFGFLKSSVGIEQTLDEFKESWENGKEALASKLEQGKSSFRMKLLQVFRKAGPRGQKFLVKPSEELGIEIEDEVEKLLQDLGGRGIPGAPVLAQACQKYKVENVLDEVVEYIAMLDAGDVDGIEVSDSEVEEEEEEESEEEESEEEEESGSGSGSESDDSRKHRHGRKKGRHSGSEESDEETGSASGSASDSGSGPVSGSGSGSESGSDSRSGDGTASGSDTESRSGSEDYSDEESEEGDDNEEEDEDGEPKKKKKKKKHKKKGHHHKVEEIAEPVFAVDPDAEEAEDGEKKEEENGVLPAESRAPAGPVKLGWRSRENRRNSLSKPEDSKKVERIKAAEIYKQVVGLDDELEKWKQEWAEVKEMLEQEELDHEARDYKVQIMEVFERANTLDAREFMMSPFEDLILDEPHVVEGMLKELDRLDVPGADFLLDAIAKFKLEKVIDPVLDYFDLLKQSDMTLERKQPGPQPDPEPELELEPSQPDPAILALFAPAFVDESPKPDPRVKKRHLFHLKDSDTDSSDGEKAPETPSSAKTKTKLLPKSARSTRDVKPPPSIPASARTTREFEPPASLPTSARNTREFKPPQPSKPVPPSPQPVSETKRKPASSPVVEREEGDSRSKSSLKEAKKSGGGFCACFSPKAVDD